MLLEEESPLGESKPYRMARDVYKSCMDIGKIERLGLEPVKQILSDLGGWPVLLGPNVTWENEAHYIWYEQVYKFREKGYSVDYLVDFSVTTDLKNSSWRILDLDQPALGMSREYLIKGMRDEDVQVLFLLLLKYVFLKFEKTYYIGVLGIHGGCSDIFGRGLRICQTRNARSAYV